MTKTWKFQIRLFYKSVDTVFQWLVQFKFIRIGKFTHTKFIKVSVQEAFFADPLNLVNKLSFSSNYYKLQIISPFHPLITIVVFLPQLHVHVYRSSSL